VSALLPVGGRKAPWLSVVKFRTSQFSVSTEIIDMATVRHGRKASAAGLRTGLPLRLTLLSK
jgi:hypothetical protein